jgi:hypothetical protein
LISAVIPFCCGLLLAIEILSLVTTMESHTSYSLKAQNLLNINKGYMMISGRMKKENIR